MYDVIEMVPLTGINMGDKSIRLLDSREEIERILGRPDSIWKNSFYYFNNELRVDFNEQGLAEFIEFLGGADGKLQPRIYGLDAFRADADTLYNALKEKNGDGINDRENGYSYGFLNLSVGVYRESIPEDVQEMIEEAANEGNPMDAGEIAHEMKRAAHWATIGIGVKGYYL